MTRVRMTMVFEFDYLGEMDMDAADRLAHNFYTDPTAFVADPEWSDILIVDVQAVDQEVTDNDGS